MRPSEMIGFMILCAIALSLFLVSLFIFRKRMKIAIGIAGILFVTCLGYYAYFPTLQEKRYEANYEALQAYLQKTYPDVEYYIDRPPLDEGAYVSEFKVNRLDSPKQGVIYHVNKNEVEQFGYWTNETYPKNINDAWQILIYNDFRELDESPIQIVKVDQYVNGELAVFSLQVDEKPTIAIFNYSNGAISLYEEKKAATGEIVEVTWENQTYMYVPNDYSGDLPENTERGKLHIR